MTIYMGYKQIKSFEERKSESQKIRDKYPDRVCIICEKAPNAGNVKNIEKIKYLVPNTLTMGQFIHIIRKKVDIEACKSLFLFVNNRVVPPTTTEMGRLYDQYKDKDDLLYMTYATENTFGN
jgi:GABA(A) receptor-associated protein